jgi:hypothetical protein
MLLPVLHTRCSLSKHVHQCFLGQVDSESQWLPAAQLLSVYRLSGVTWCLGEGGRTILCSWQHQWLEMHVDRYWNAPSPSRSNLWASWKIDTLFELEWQSKRSEPWLSWHRCTGSFPYILWRLLQLFAGWQLHPWPRKVPLSQFPVPVNKGLSSHAGQSVLDQVGRYQPAHFRR